MTPETIGIAITVIATIGVILIAFIRHNLKICQPNEVLIFSGRRRRLPDGTLVGFRIIKGGRRFKWPIVETVSRMPLTTIPIEIELRDALAAGIIPVCLQVIAHVKIAGGEQQGLLNAVERLLGLRQEQIVTIARESIEGTLRGVLATLTPEQANTDRVTFERRVVEAARVDLRNLGLELDTFRILQIWDRQGYLEAIGRQKSAAVRRDAEIAEATAQAATRVVAAEETRKASIAEATAGVEVADAENALRVRRAELATQANRAEQVAEVASDIARVEEEQRLERERVELSKLRTQADVVIPAQARKDAAQLEAVGQAARTLEEGRSTAEALTLLRQVWDEGKARELFLLQQLPDMVDRFSRVVASNLAIEKLTIVDSGNGSGIPNFVKGTTGSIIALMEQIKGATGLDIQEILQARGEGQGRLIKKELG